MTMQNNNCFFYVLALLQLIAVFELNYKAKERKELNAYEGRLFSLDNYCQQWMDGGLT